MKKSSDSDVVFRSLVEIDYEPKSIDVGVAFDLLRQLKGLENRQFVLRNFALVPRHDVLKQLAFASMVNFDGNADEAWKLALGSVEAVFYELNMFCRVRPLYLRRQCSSRTLRQDCPFTGRFTAIARRDTHTAGKADGRGLPSDCGIRDPPCRHARFDANSRSGS